MTKHSEKRKVPYTPLKMFDLVADMRNIQSFFLGVLLQGLFQMTIIY